jgi:fumarylacetoacetate (FAA) hydrolase family protein
VIGIGRVLGPLGPCVVRVAGDQVFDLTRSCPTIGHWLGGQVSTAELLQSAAVEMGTVCSVQWLAPFDIQPIKACGVTFIASLLERLVEELARGQTDAADSIRQSFSAAFLQSLRDIRPGSPEALQLREELLAQNRWSQYLEVGLGSDPEVFTKAPPMAALGEGAEAGLLSDSTWNNPEPEIVLAINCRGEAVGASLGNDVNLRDVEGRSALLLGRAKDNRGSTVIGPWIRVFDRDLNLQQLTESELTLEIHGPDGFHVAETAPLSGLVRGFQALIDAVFDQHDYPDGVALFTGSAFAPTWDRSGSGEGFTHLDGDRVTIRSPLLGELRHTVRRCPDLPAWEFGLAALMQNLAERRLL